MLYSTFVCNTTAEPSSNGLTPYRSALSSSDLNQASLEPLRYTQTLLCIGHPVQLPVASRHTFACTVLVI